MLTGQGATRYAQISRFEICNILTDRARRRWELRVAKAATSEFDDTKRAIVDFVMLLYSCYESES